MKCARLRGHGRICSPAEPTRLTGAEQGMISLTRLPRWLGLASLHKVQLAARVHGGCGYVAVRAEGQSAAASGTQSPIVKQSAPAVSPTASADQGDGGHITHDGSVHMSDAARKDPSRAQEARGVGGATLLEDASQQQSTPRVVLKRGKSRLFRSGAPLVYGGAIDSVVGRPPPEAGDVVVVADSRKRGFAWGVYNPASMFRVRVMQSEVDVEREPECLLDLPALIRTRVHQAVALRRTLGLPSEHTNVYRLINSEGDRLSGLIADVLGDTVVLLSCAAWVERHSSLVQSAIQEATGCTRIVWRSSVDILREEGVALTTGATGGGAEGVVQVVENGVVFDAALQGQKTGFYADQRDNRAYLRSLSRGKTVLDLCTYSGGFAVNAGVGGATHVTGVDSSASALLLAESNAALNGLPASSCSFLRDDVAAFLQSARSVGRQWDVVVLDPPKLAPTRKVLERATAKYRRLNALAMQAVAPGGLLMTCSCSGAMTQSGTFTNTLQDASTMARRSIRLLRHSGAGADHTMVPGYPEGAYLTNMLLHVH